jgi:hypothetical protein
LLKADGTPWMADLQKMAPKLNWDDLTQTAALPLGSWIKTDPWDDKVHMLNAKRYAPMNARDKMPLEVTPLFYKLQRYDAARVDAPAAPAAAAQPDAQPAGSGQLQVPAADQPSASQPDAGSQTATPAQPAPSDATDQRTGTSQPPSR